MARAHHPLRVFASGALLALGAFVPAEAQMEMISPVSPSAMAGMGAATSKLIAAGTPDIDAARSGSTVVSTNTVTSISSKANELNRLPLRAESSSISVPVNRSSLVVLPVPMSEVMVANPDIADVHAHNSTHLTVIGKRLGRTDLRIFAKDGKESKLIRQISITVGYDLPAVRQALRNFLPGELIGVEMVNNGIALTGKVSSATVADKATQIVKDFVQGGDKDKQAAAKNKSADPNATAERPDPEILNFLQITSGQQVMLRVRVGEIQRSALKNLGVDLNGFSGSSVAGSFFGSGLAGLTGLIIPEGANDATAASHGPGHFTYNSDSNGGPTKVNGLITGYWQPQGAHGLTLATALHALEQDGLFKLLAEPNLVAISGEEANFLAGGEIPVPVPQNNGNGGNSITIDYKPYGVAVKFKPFVLSENRIRMEVKPEVSELDPGNGIALNNFNIPALTTRRAGTVVELAPGESYMIAGLLSDKAQSTLNQLPGVKELPILGALFRSTEFQRNETELVIAVTPYIVDPMKNSDIKLPTDDYRPASTMEMFFYGALGSLSGQAATLSQTPDMLEGPIGFMVD